MGSLTPREHSAKIAWESKTDEERAEIVAKGKRSLLSVHSTNENESASVGGSTCITPFMGCFAPLPGTPKSCAVIYEHEQYAI